MLITRLWAIREDERFRDKVVEMATEFCIEASVLISVLGILEAALAWRGIPPYQDFLYSGILGASFFTMGCMIQAWRAVHRGIGGLGGRRTVIFGILEAVFVVGGIFAVGLWAGSGPKARKRVSHGSK